MSGKVGAQVKPDILTVEHMLTPSNNGRRSFL